MTETELDLVVAARQDVAVGTVALDLRHPAGDELPAWAPGAHIDLVLADGLIRQYSLSSDPGDRTSWRVAVLREPEGRGGSAFVHDKLLPGDSVRVRGPRNHFPLEPAAHYLFIAGGIGITPILPMLTVATAAGTDWRLVYGGRSTASMAFIDEVTGYGDRVELCPQDQHGLLDLDTLLREPAPDTLVYCCGPGPLLDAVEACCAAWPNRSLHVERFSPKEVGEPVRTDSFEVELAVTGTTLTVPPDRSVLDVVEEAGVEVLASCMEGTCGTCETTVLAGAVDHRDSLLTADQRAAQDTMFICVSRAACPKLVLKL
ncbi:PDR/VanB family oxidoreductase [Pseudonocardia nigra]|uniref:PDR/VanB family oxidoreductase n=1 Tax=Pseudonocardia nigra TaxID=1921578 RepID=UPI001C5E5193|nr:PDR/VanB family oxidoreductase [Pseudonocardia nigra]